MKRLAFIFCLLPAVRSHAQFSETSTANGIFLVNDNPLFGNGTCFVDFDDDGWDDLTFASKNQSVLFYKNNNGQFTPYFPTFDPQLPATGDIKCVLWVDYDNDGDKDFILSAVYATLKVYQNQGDMTFIEVGSQIGILPETVQIYGVSAGDIDNDGCLDLFVCKYHNHQLVTGYQYSNRVYHNNCDGTFSDVTVSAGFGTSIQASFACIWLDYNMDGYQDVYVINDRLNYPNFLYKNNGNGGFINVTASSGAGVYIEAMSCSSTDYDNDGDLDIYVSNTSAGNVLLNNNLGLQIFTDVASSAGVVANQLCWGALWIDYNNDMWEDLFVSTLGNVGTTLLQNLFFVSDGDGTFHSGISETGILGDTDGSYTVAKGDYNQDGYYDYATNNASPASASLWQNNGGSNHWISVSLEGTISNKDGIGSWIECFVDGNKYVQYTFCGENYLGQNSEREIFGLAGNTAVDSLRIKWLSGIVETYYSPEIDEHHHYVEGQSLSTLPVLITYSGDLSICPGSELELTCEEGNSYLWNTGDTTQSIVVTEPGVYYASIQNIYGFEQYSDSVNVVSQPPPNPVITFTNVSCFNGEDGTISVSLQGEELGTIVWNTGLELPELEGLSAGSYSFDVTNPDGCLAQGVVEITEPDSISLEVFPTSINCFGEENGTCTLEIVGGTPGYEVDWMGFDPEALPAGSYTVQVIDSNNCLAETNFIIDSPDELLVNISTTPDYENGPGGTAQLTITGGIEPYEISWSNNAMNTTLVEDLFAGFYSVMVMDANGCSAEVNFEIEFITPIAEEENTPGLSVFPNPAHGSISIGNIPADGSGQITIFDVNARTVKTELFELAQNVLSVNIETINPGLYWIQIVQNSGERMCTYFICE